MPVCHLLHGEGIKMDENMISKKTKLRSELPITPEEDRDKMLVDQEYRLTLLELGLSI